MLRVGLVRAQESADLGFLIDLSWFPGGCENLRNISIGTKSPFDGSTQEVFVGTCSCEGVKKKKIQIINWWEQSKNYRAPAIWSDHCRSAWAMGGNWILKTSFIVDQLLCFKYLREESDFLLSEGTLVCYAFGPLQLGWGCVILPVLQHELGVQQFTLILILHTRT